LNFGTVERGGVTAAAFTGLSAALRRGIACVSPLSQIGDRPASGPLIIA
jgi:hypothetical protein